MNSIPRISGIYKITCTANGKIYIGSALDLRGRWHRHSSELRRNKHSNQKLQRAYNKYGSDAFIYEVLEAVLPISLTAREQYWFHKLKPFGEKGFNIAPTAGSSLGRQLSREAIEMSASKRRGIKQSPEIIEKRISPLRGRKCPEQSTRMIGNTYSRGTKRTLEQCENMSLSRKGKKHTLEARENMRQAQLRSRERTSDARKKQSQIMLGNTYALGRKQSPEARKKIGDAHRGKKVSPEAIEKTRQANIGRVKTPEEIEKRKQTLLANDPSPKQLAYWNRKQQ